MNKAISTTLKISQVLAVGAIGFATDVIFDRILDQFEKNSPYPKIINGTIFCGLMYTGYKALSDLYNEK